MGRNTTGPPPLRAAPGELRCICVAMECYRRRQTTMTYAREQNNTAPHRCRFCLAPSHPYIKRLSFIGLYNCSDLLTYCILLKLCMLNGHNPFPDYLVSIFNMPFFCSISHMQSTCSNTLKNYPCTGTDGRLFASDVCANFKVM